MSRALLICSRNGEDLQRLEPAVVRLNRALAPDNIEPTPPSFRYSRGILLAAFNPRRTLSWTARSLCIGALLRPETDWATPGSPPPDGSFAILRTNDECVELVSDITASRTLYYVQTRDLFVASSSQRAIIALLGEFEPNRLAFAWFLSAGALGPDLSWDARLRTVPPDARLCLNRKTWELSLRATPVHLNPVPGSARYYEDEMLEALHVIFASIDVTRNRWAVPLSGGYDSRAILMFLSDRSNVEAVTWGTRDSLDDPEGDAAVAHRVAADLGVRHHFSPLDLSDEEPATLIHRYVAAGETRVDHLAGYLDGFAVWKWLFESGFDGILRGDICWPHLGAPPAVHADVRQNTSINLLRLGDFSNLPDPDALELPEQPLPEKYEPLPGETLASYRDRLYQVYRMPGTLAGLNALKSAYVEILNPFLFARFIRLARRLPDDVRWDKKILKRIVRKQGPNIPMAVRPSGPYGARLLRVDAFRKCMLDELRAARSRSLLSEALLERAAVPLREAQADEPAPPRRRGALAGLRSRVRRATLGPRPWGQRTMTPETLTLRTVLIAATCRVFAADATLLPVDSRPVAAERS